MDLALRPMSTSQVLDRTFYIYRNHFVLLAGIGSLLPALLLIMQLSFIPLGMPPRGNQAPELLAVLFLGYFGCYGVIYLVGNALAGGATVYGVSKLHLGESITIGQAYKQVFSRFWRVLVVIVLLGLIVFGSLMIGEVIAIIVVTVTAGSSRIFGGGGALAGVGVVIAIIWAVSIFAGAILAALFFYSRLSLSVPACILEKLPVGESLRRSWYLTQGSVWRIILVHLLTWVLSIVLALALAVPGQLYLIATHNKQALLGIILQHLGGFIAGVIANPIATTAIALIYYDQRVRKEAFDLQLMMEAVGQQQAAQPAAAAVPPALG